MFKAGARFPGAPSNSSVRVLQISDDPNLAATRLLVLQSAGFKVEHRGSSALRSVDGCRSFQVIVLCQSLDAAIAAELSHRICAAAPDARILRVRYALHDQVLADVAISAPVQPHELVNAVERLAHSPGGRA